MENFEGVSREQRRKNIRRQRIKSILSALGFVAVIAIIFLMQKCNDNNEYIKYKKAYDAGYNLGYYVSYLEDTVVVYDEKRAIFNVRHIKESTDFIYDHLSDNESDGFYEGFEQGLKDGYSDAEKNYLKP